MKLTPLIQKAIYRSAELHAPHRRKVIERPYIVHPFSVAWLLSEYTKDEHIVAAAFLHDVLEDVEGYDADAMRREFGEKVTAIVEGVSEAKHHPSDPSQRLSWEGRKLYYIDRLNTASRGSLLVSCADKIHNMRSLLEIHALKGDAVWNLFNAAPDRQYWFFEEVYLIMKRRLDSDMVKEYRRALAAVKKLLH